MSEENKQELEWEKVEDTEQTEMWNGKDVELSVGDQIEGKFVEKKENIGINQSNIYLIQTESAAEPVGVWGSTVLDGKFANIPVGNSVRIVFTGLKQGKAAGRKPYKTYDVYQASEKPLN